MKATKTLTVTVAALVLAATPALATHGTIGTGGMLGGDQTHPGEAQQQEGDRARARQEYEQGRSDGYRGGSVRGCVTDACFNGRRDGALQRSRDDTRDLQQREIQRGREVDRTHSSERTAGGFADTGGHGR